MTRKYEELVRKLRHKVECPVCFQVPKSHEGEYIEENFEKLIKLDPDIKQEHDIKTEME